MLSEAHRIALLRHRDLFTARRRCTIEETHKVVAKRILPNMKGSTFCLTTDGWSNIRNDPVVNYMEVSPESSFFLESVSKFQQGQDHKFIAEDVRRVIRKYKFSLFAVVVTENTSANKKTRKLGIFC